MTILATLFSIRLVWSWSSLRINFWVLEKRIENDERIKHHFKKKQTCKPDFVSRLLETLIIYLVPQLLTESIFLPFNNGREALNCWYTWNFTAWSLPGFTTASPVPAFCCTCPIPIARNDGCYPLCFPMVSGLSSLHIKWTTIRRSAVQTYNKIPIWPDL